MFLFRPRGNVSIDNEQERFTIICGVVVGVVVVRGVWVWDQAIRETCYLELTSLYVVR